MGRNLSPLLRRELANLAKDANSRRSAMKALKSYVKDLDSKAIPHFLAQVSERTETKAPGSPSGECTISLYEVLARVHGPNIVPQIDNIMSTIMRTLSTSAGSFPLHQACSKVVPAIARYGIDPSTPSSEKTRIICCLCKPLCDALMGLQESVASGAALCLKALVESDNWKFASDDMVNEVCLKVAGAMEEKVTQTSYHMSLVMALAKHNNLTAEAYARSLVRSGLQILTADVAESNSQKRLSAIQMINFLIKCVDSRSISSELGKIIDTLEKCQTDQMAFVKNAAMETLETVKIITTQKYKQGICSYPITESNFYRKNEDARDNGCHTEFASPESQTVDSFLDHDTFLDSPMSSIGQPSFNVEHPQRTNRRLWGSDHGGVDVSLKDGLFLKAYSGCDDSKDDFEQLRCDELTDASKEHSAAFSGFLHASVTNKATRSTTSSPQRSRPQVTIEDIKIYTTPRKLIRSLQDSTDATSGSPLLTTPTSGEARQNLLMALNGENHSHNMKCNVIKTRYIEKMRMLSHQSRIQDAELVLEGDESVSSTGDVPEVSAGEVSRRGGCEDSDEVPMEDMRKIRYGRVAFGFVCGLLLVFLAVILSAMRMDNDELFFDVVPT